MIIDQWIPCARCCILVLVLTTLSAFYAYRVNERRDPDDPEKTDYARRAPWLTPVTLPFLALVNIPVFILSSLAFGFLLVLFPFALLLFRKPFLVKWVLEQALKLGSWILKINTALLRIAGFEPAQIKLLHEQRHHA